MATDEELKNVLQRAAELVKDLPEQLQAEAFNRAFESLSGEAGATRAVRGTKERKTRTRGKRTAAGQPKRSRRRSTPTRLKALNLRPRGEKSLVDFVAEKKPSSDHERKLVSVYYLTNVLETAGVTVDHVYSCFKEVGWKVPTDIATSLGLTASKKAWLDTSDMTSIRVAIPGENYVEQDLPRTKAKEDW